MFLVWIKESSMLKFDFNKAKAQVRELRSIADGMEKNKKLADAIEKIKNAWEGQAAKDFIAKSEELRNLVASEITHIRNLARNIELSANAIADAEKKAQEILTTNTSRTT